MGSFVAVATLHDISIFQRLICIRFILPHFSGPGMQSVRCLRASVSDNDLSSK